MRRLHGGYKACCIVVMKSFLVEVVRCFLVEFMRYFHFHV